MLAHENSGEATAVRGHDNQVASLLLGGLNDSLGRVLIFGMYGFESHAILLRGLADRS